MKLLFLFTFILLSSLYAEDYEMGHGLTLSEKLHIGAYISADYESSNDKKQFRLDDVAILAYGRVLPELSYLVELEATPFYQKNYTTGAENSNQRFYYERAYADYGYSEMFNFRVGKQISPIGYWNLEPINVLRDTSSDPLYSYMMFPKYLTGVDIYGYADESATVKYHAFVQKNNNLDGETLNITTDRFFAFSLEHELNSEISYGGSAGNFVTKNKEHTNFVQIDGKYDIYPFVFQMEAAYNSNDDTIQDEQTYRVGGYGQGIYHFNIRHALIGRYEYFHDSSNSQTNNIGVLGYSYRPIYPVSLKGEVQYNSDERLNKFIISFSVLF